MASSSTLVIGGDLEVGRIGFGAMRLSGAGIWGDPPDRAAACHLLRRAVELGANFIDTADAYGPGTNETLIADALHPYREGLVIATKGGIVRPAQERWDRDGRAVHLRAACEASLRRLRVERIDLYQLHAVDPDVRLEESLGELARLQQEGKVRHVGVSNVTLAELARARRIVNVVSVQNRSNVADRSSDAVLAACERGGIAFIPWSPLARSPREPAEGPRARLAAWAGRKGVSHAQAAIAWLLARSPVTLPIPGTANLEHLEENMAAVSVRMSAADMAEIEGTARP